MSKGGARHKGKDAIDMVRAHSLFALHQPLIADLGPYEIVPRAGAIDPLGLHILSPLLLDLVGQLVPSAEPKEADIRFALSRLLMLCPDMNKTDHNNLTWINLKAERLGTALNHLRRLQRSDEISRYKVMAKLTGPAWTGHKQRINNRTNKQTFKTNNQHQQPLNPTSNLTSLGRTSSCAGPDHPQNR